MILKSMTAVFGKLEGDTLTLTPGLNLIEEPNEWGKSTWCAFLLAMLYGIDTGLVRQAHGGPDGSYLERPGHYHSANHQGPDPHGGIPGL